MSEVEKELTDTTKRLYLLVMAVEEYIKWGYGNGHIEALNKFTEILEKYEKLMDSKGE